MINVSNAFKEKLENGGILYLTVDVTFPDGTTATWDEEIMNGQNTLVDGASSSSFPIGVAIEKYITLCIDNREEQFADKELYGAVLRPKFNLDLDGARLVEGTDYEFANVSKSDSTVRGMLLNNTKNDFEGTITVVISSGTQTETFVQDIFVDANDYEPFSIDTVSWGSIESIDFVGYGEGTTESVNRGKFTVTTPEEYGEVINLTAVDDMYKADTDYYTNLVLPQTLISLVNDACSRCGITLGSTSMSHGSYVVNEIPEGLTFRTFFAYAAMIECANARLDTNGYLRFVKYDFSQYEESDNRVGVARVGQAQVGVGDGWTTGYQKIRNFATGATFGADDVVITGIQVTNGDESYQYGEDGYVLVFENKLSQTTEEDDDGNRPENSDLKQIATWLGEEFVGATFRVMSGDIYADPTIEFGDMAVSSKYVASTGETREYRTPITDVSFLLGGYTTIQTQAEDPLRLSSSYLSSSVQTLISARQLVAEERSEREKAVERLAERLANSSGLYMTVEVQPDGSSIYYMHDKPTLEESEIVWKLTAEALGISTDGGKTYPYGLTVDGEAILNRIYAIGIDADYITTGSLLIKGATYYSLSGQFTFAANKDTQISISSGKTDVAFVESIVLAGYTEGTDYEVSDIYFTTANGVTVINATITNLRSSSLTGTLTINFGIGNDTIIFQADVGTHSLYINTDQFTLDKSGNATFSGELKAPSGNIGDWYINDGLWNGCQSMDDTENGTYIGAKGIRQVKSGEYLDITGTEIVNGDDIQTFEIRSGSMWLGYQGNQIAYITEMHFEDLDKGTSESGMAIGLTSKGNAFIFQRDGTSTVDTPYIINFNNSAYDSRYRHIFSGAMYASDLITGTISNAQEADKADALSESTTFEIAIGSIGSASVSRTLPQDVSLDISSILSAWANAQGFVTGSSGDFVGKNDTATIKVTESIYTSSFDFSFANGATLDISGVMSNYATRNKLTVNISTSSSYSTSGSASAFGGTINLSIASLLSGITASSAETATKLATQRTFYLRYNSSSFYSAYFDGSANVNLDLDDLMTKSLTFTGSDTFTSRVAFTGTYGTVAISGSYTGANSSTGGGISWGGYNLIWGYSGTDNIAVGSSYTTNMYVGAVDTSNTSVYVGQNYSSSSSTRVQLQGAQVMIGVSNYTSTVYIRASSHIYMERDYELGSDRSLKKDISTLDIKESLIDKIDALEPVSFRYKDGDDESLHYGYIAQDVQKVFPDLVVEHPARNVARAASGCSDGVTTESVKEDETQDTSDEDEETVLAIRYNGIIPLLHMKIKEQQATIETLENSIAEFETRIKALEDAIKA